MLRISDSSKYPAKLVGAWATMIGPVKDQTSESELDSLVSRFKITQFLFPNSTNSEIKH